MNNLLSLLLGSLTQQSSVNAASKKSGLSTKTILTIISYALPLILKALNKNASNTSGAQSLLTALLQHTSKRSIPEQIENADVEDGAKIMRHILGNDQDAAIADIARGTNTSTADVSSVLNVLAPTLLNSLSLATQTANTVQVNSSKGFDLSDGLDANDIAALLGGGNTLSSLAGMFAPKADQASTDAGSQLLTSLLSLMK
ncbi:MAG: DUF937 domain-containing protein [Solobacterium sp.]|nr:DUF937 domain-containing protein [Solobacterium sp.]